MKTHIVTTISGLCLVMFLFASPQLSAQTVTPCFNDSPCTAGDVGKTTFSLTAAIVVPCSGPGSSATLDLTLMYNATAATRYDVGTWVATDGGAANGTGQCVATAVTPANTNPDPTDQGDNSCWDISQDVVHTTVVENAVIACIDDDNDGFVDVSACLTYAQNNNAVCSTDPEALPGTGSKCNCQNFDLDGDNPVPTPVELVSFTGKLVDGDAILTWETATELNNAGFNVERASGDEVFEWIGYVSGRGSTLEPTVYSFTSRDLAPGSHRFRLKQVDFDGAVDYSTEVEVVVGVPSKYVLEEAYPNPFNPQTTINFVVAESQHVTMNLYNALGVQVQSLFSGTAQGNEAHKIRIDGSGLPNGVYIVQLEGDNFVGTQEIVLMK